MKNSKDMLEEKLDEINVVLSHDEKDFFTSVMEEFSFIPMKELHTIFIRLTEDQQSSLISDLNNLVKRWQSVK